MPATLNIVPFGPQATAALRSVIAAAQSTDPLAPVTVAVPSNYAGLSLRRQLARDSAVLNVRFLALARVAELLGAPALAAAGRRPLTTWLRTEAVRAALSDHVVREPHSLFAPAHDHLATELGLDATFRDLRESDAPALELLATASPRAAEVIDIFRSYRALVSSRYYDQSDLALAATDAVTSGSATLRDIGHVILFLPRLVSQAELQLIEALTRRKLATIILGSTGSESGDVATRRLRARLEPLAGTAITVAAAQPFATHVVAVIDTHEEVRMVARLIMERLRSGTPLHRMAVLYPNRENYAASLHEQFQAAGIPHNGPSAATLAQSITGRFLLALLKLPSFNFRRDAVMDWLTSAPVIEPGYRHVPAGLWDRISRGAGVVAAPEQWHQRLAVHSRALELRKVDEDRPISEGQRRHIDRELPQVARLQAFVSALVKELSPQGRSTWEEHARWARHLLKRYMGDRADFSGCPGTQQQEAEHGAYVEVTDQLGNLEALDEVSRAAGSGRSISAATFTRALEQLLQTPAPRATGFGTGVFLSAFGEATGMEFDVLFVLGMVEGLAPPLGRDDPLLPDHEREAASGLPLRAARRDDETRNYLAALASAPDRILFYPAADLAGQQKRLPSRWLLASAAALSAHSGPLSTRDFFALPPAPWLTRSASFHAALRSQVEPALLQEHDLRSLSMPGGPAKHPLAKSEPIIARGFQALSNRRQPSLTRFDGLIGPRPGLRPSAAHPTSPTALQTWATCPFSYFLKNVIRVGEQEVPEDILVLSAAERGNIIHAALDEFMKANAAWRLPWAAVHRRALRDIASRLCDEAEAQGITGKPLLWKIERDRINRDLDGFLEADSERSSESGFHFLAGEHPFGNAGDPSPDVQVTLSDDTAIAFRGRIDRVDRHANGSLAVYDYKSGSTYSFKDMDVDATKRGQLLQLPVYALAARDAFANGRPVEVDANYWFVTQRGEYERKGGQVTVEGLEAFRAQLLNIATGIGQGVFIANPGELDSRPGTSPSRNCAYCPFDRLCPQDRRRTWDLKQADPAASAYLALNGSNGDSDATD